MWLRTYLVPLLFGVILFVTLPPSTAHAAWSHDSGINVGVTQGVTQAQANPAMDSDGSGGFFVAWNDARNGNQDIFVQRMTADGNIAPGWPVSGVPVCTQTSVQSNPSVASDGSGGIYVAWQDARVSSLDRDIYVTHVMGSGSLAPGWPINGTSLSTFPGKDETGVRLAPDGNGGAFAVWSLAYGAGDGDIYWARVNAAGTIAFTGALDARGNYQVFPSVAADGTGNLLVAYQNNDVNGTAGSYSVNVMRVNSSGGSVFGPMTITPVASYGYSPTLVADGTGGGYVLYPAPNGSVNNLYVQHFTSNGALAAGWSGTARSLVSNVTTGYMDYGWAISDGAGGLFAAWSDQRNGTGNWDVFATRILSNGGRPGGWPPEGLTLATGSQSQNVFGIAPDGTGGAVILWHDLRYQLEVYAGRLTGAGSKPPGWGSSGNAIFTGGSASSPFPALGDGHGGAIVVTPVTRGSTSSILAQNVDGFGQLGDMRPLMGGVRDVAADQGGKVRLTWGASWLDQPASLGISQYWIWCQTPASAAQSEVTASRGRWISPGDAAPGGSQRLYRHAQETAAQYAWQFVVALPTNGSSQYSDVVATVSDSMAGYNPYTVFMVEARGATAGTFWDSAPDSGYSVDNLAPGMPSPFTETFSGGIESLHWGEVSAPDLLGYRLYRGTTSAFVPGPSNLVVAQADTSYALSGGSAGDYYKLSSVDIHGNESAYAVLQSTVDIGPQSFPAAIALAPVYPNPAAGPVSLDFELPKAMPVTIAVHDVQGRQVVMVARATWPAGVHHVRWDGRDRDGRPIGSGLYYIVLTANGEQRTRRLVRL